MMENFHQIMLEKEVEMMENSNIMMRAKFTHSMGPRRLNKLRTCLKRINVYVWSKTILYQFRCHIIISHSGQNQKVLIGAKSRHILLHIK